MTSPELKKLFGPPPVLSSESIKTYNSMVARSLDSVKPRDFIEQLLTRDIVDASWEICRYLKHKSLTFEHNLRERLKQQEKSAREYVERRKQQLAIEQEKKANQPETELDRVGELQLVIDESVNEVERILQQRPVDLAIDDGTFLQRKLGDLDHAQALKEAIDFHEKLDRLLNAAVARRNNAIDQLERYRNGLGQHIRQLSDEIIDAQFSEARLDPSQEPPGPSIKAAGQ